MIEATNNPEPGEVDADYLETIALLQDEITRLEGELLARELPEERVAGRHDLTSDPDEPDQRPHHVEIERLEAELTSRDETINLLLEQLRLVEEAESASRVEWEQLTQWVADVEERIERQEGTGPARFDQEVETHRKEAEDCRLQLDLERKTWNDQRRGLENEIERLQTLMARPAQEAATPSDGVSLAILKSENQRLRQLCHDLDATVKSQTRSLREAVEAGRRELEEVRKERDCVQDERDRERREYEIAIAALRSHSSRTALCAHESDGQATRPETTTSVSSALDADLRIREFRQHLKEIHSHEAEARNRNRLGARLSRLWTRTGPKST